jgi:hypothetical protein
MENVANALSTTMPANAGYDYKTGYCMWDFPPN